jgi:hypothetical protein
MYTKDVKGRDLNLGRTLTILTENFCEFLWPLHENSCILPPIRPYALRFAYFTKQLQNTSKKERYRLSQYSRKHMCREVGRY